MLAQVSLFIKICLYDFCYLHQLEELEVYIAKPSIAFFTEPSNVSTSEEPLESWRLKMRQGSTTRLLSTYVVVTCTMYWKFRHEDSTEH